MTLLTILSTSHLRGQELKFPQIVTIKYEAPDPQTGGQFIIWVEREKIWYGLDQKLIRPLNPSKSPT